MKRVLPLIFVTMVVIVLTTQVFSQGPLRLLRNRNQVPVPLTPPRPIFPPFHYPPGVVPAMENMPLPTRNPSFDVDLSTPQFDELPVAKNIIVDISPSLPTRADHLQKKTPPVLPQRFQPVPAFRQSQTVACGTFVSMPQKKSGTPLVTPRVIIQEEYEESIVTIQLPLVPSDNTPTEADPFDNPSDEEDEPVVVTPEVVEDDETDPFGGGF